MPRRALPLPDGRTVSAVEPSVPLEPPPPPVADPGSARAAHRVSAGERGSPGSDAQWSSASRRAGLMSSYPFPITGAKVHPPLLRADILSRPRLNDWLDRAATGRVVLVIAEAGFGKTTLLADWASRSPRRTAWYRLEPDDRDWLVFLRHLVAAGREVDPDFGTETLDLILGLGAGGPTQADVITSIVREYREFAGRLPEGLTLIVDDQHVIDGSTETDDILRRLIDQTGSGLSIVIASRATPRLKLAGLRSRGGLRRLDGADLRFDVPETDRL